MSWDNPWDQAQLALYLLTIDPSLGGVALRARSGPVRDALLAHVPQPTRLHPAMSDDAMFGGIDLTATLSTGRVIEKQGLLQGKGPFLLSMAERCPAALAARLALHADAHPITLILLDEGSEDDETAPETLTERLAFRCDLSDIAIAATGTTLAPPRSTTPACHSDADLARLVTVADDLGINSLRAPTLALRCARAHAAYHGRDTVTDDDLSAAVALTFAHRATRLPPPPEQDAPQQPPDTQDPTNSQTDMDLPDDLLLDAVRALLPDDVLARLSAKHTRAGRGSGSGATRKGNRRGRPLPSRAGRISDQARVDLIGTLRAAAPWQTIRRRDTGRDGLHIRGTDIRTKRFEDKSDRLLIFTVDASGSAALARLNEAKGAVELLLAQAYARRDHVALIAFRGTTAELLLPPTRSLVQTKRRLASLPGGGGTPLSAGLDTALAQSIQALGRGMTPTICLLTDGRANIARDGTPDRAAAAKDAEQTARALRAQGIETLVIDTGNRPSAALRTLAQTLDGPYLPLPRANAERMALAVSAALTD